MSVGEEQEVYGHDWKETCSMNTMQAANTSAQGSLQP